MKLENTNIYLCVYWLKFRTFPDLERRKFTLADIFIKIWVTLHAKLFLSKLQTAIRVNSHQDPIITRDIQVFFIWLAACEHIISLAITWTSSYLTYEKPARDARLRLAGMPSHAHTLSCLLVGFCSLPALCFHGNINIISCWNILNIANLCLNKSDIADAVIALISENTLYVCLPHLFFLPCSHFFLSE